MADDILLTPEEQDERAKKWLKENGLSLIVGVAVGIGAIYGFNSYKAKQIEQAEQASTLYTNILKKTEQSNISEFDEELATLKTDFAKTPYAAKAALIKASKLAVSDIDAAQSELTWVLENARELGLQETARVRLIKIYLAQDNAEKAASLLNEANKEGYQSIYAELTGDLAVLQGNNDDARAAYQEAIDSLNQTDRSYQMILTLKLNQVPAIAVAKTAEEKPSSELISTETLEQESQ